MLEVETVGALPSEASAPGAAEIRELCERAAASAGIADGHVAVQFVGARDIAELNARHRGRERPTDVLSFPIDGADPRAGAGDGAGAGAPPRELGDIVICPEHTADVREAVVHGMLHLLGMDHETDDGEMLALQRRLLAEQARSRAAAPVRGPAPEAPP